MKWASVSVAVAVYPFLRAPPTYVSSGQRIWNFENFSVRNRCTLIAPHVSRHGNHIAELSSQLWVKPVRLNSAWYCLPLIMHAWFCWSFDTLKASRGDEEEGGVTDASQTFISAFLVCSYDDGALGKEDDLCCLIGRNEILE